MDNLKLGSYATLPIITKELVAQCCIQTKRKKKTRSTHYRLISNVADVNGFSTEKRRKKRNFLSIASDKDI